MSLSAGTVVAYAITFLISPILTRIYSADAFGEFSAFHSSVVVLVVLGTLAYEYAIILPKEDKMASQVFQAGVIASLIVFIALIGTAIITYSWLSEKLGYSEAFFLLLPFGVLIQANYNLLVNWFVRFKSFNLISISKVIQSTTIGVIQIGWTTISITSFGMILGHAGGRFAHILYQVISRFKELKLLYSKFDLAGIKIAATTYSKQPKFVLFSNLLSILSLEIPVFLIGSFFGKDDLGYYGLALRVTTIPMMLLGTSVSNVFYQRIAEKFANQEVILPSISKVWLSLFLIGLLPFGILFFFSEPIFQFVFGTEWIRSGSIASILAPLLFIQFMSSSTGKALMVVDAQERMPLFSFLHLLARSVPLLIGSYYFDFEFGLWLMVSANTLSLILYNLYLVYKVKKTQASSLE